VRRLLAVELLSLGLASPAIAEGWRLDLGVRGAGTVELATASPDRVGVVPSVGVRVEHRLGPVFVGGAIAAGFPAYFGQHEAAASVDREHVLRSPTCDRVAAIGDCPARISIDAGIDAGMAMLFYDAPPELPAASDGLLYWGPFARARIQLRATWATPNDRAVGIVVGLGLAASRAHYMSTDGGTGVRAEPSIELGLDVRL